MSEKKESAAFILSNKARFLDWVKRNIKENPSIMKGAALPRELMLKYRGRTARITIFRDNYKDAESYTVNYLEERERHVFNDEARFTTDGEIFPYDPRFLAHDTAFEFMWDDIFAFIARMPLHIVVLDKSNVSAQFKSIEPLGDDWDKGADIPDPEIFVGVLRAPDEQSAFEAVEYVTGYPQDVLKVSHIIP